MKTTNLNKAWDRVVAETHCVKPHRANRIQREALFGLQILLSQYESAKKERNKKLMEFYADVLGIYEGYGVLA